MFFVNGHAVLKTDWNGPKNFRAIGVGSVNQKNSYKVYTNGFPSKRAIGD